MVPLAMHIILQHLRLKVKVAHELCKLLLDDAGIKAQDVQYLNAHGTSTPVGDLYEVQAIKNTFGDAAKSLKVSSTKSMTGHLLGATGGIEAIFLRYQFVIQR